MHQNKAIVISSFYIMYLIIEFKHITEIIRWFVVHKFIPKFQTLDIKYVLYLNKFNLSKRGSVCELYLPFVIMRRARFCSFDMRSHSKPQFVIPNWRCERVKESYINSMAERGKCRFRLFITPNVRGNLLAIFWVCDFQSIRPFTVNPRKLNSVTRSIMALFIIRHGISFSVKILWR